MRKLLIVFLGLALAPFINAQELDSAKYYIGLGVEKHDNGDYTGALAEYEKAINYDSTNITAHAEKGMTYYYLQDYDNSIKSCKKAISINPKSRGLKYVYSTYGNTLDILKKPEEAVEIYDQGLEQFPDFFQLYFNKGVTLAGLEKYDEALDCFNNAVSCNPKHASSHNAIGRLLKMKKNDIPALMALGRFMVIEPQSSRAQANLPIVNKIMTAGAEKTGKKSVSINLDMSTFGDTESDTVQENDFHTTALILSLTAALDYDKKNKKKSKAELFQGKMETVCASLKEVKKDNYGFYWDYYAPYFIEMKDKNHMETFSNLVYASSDDKKITNWLENNGSKIKSFYNWSSHFKWPQRN